MHKNGREDIVTPYVVTYAVPLQCVHIHIQLKNICSISNIKSGISHFLKFINAVIYEDILMKY